MSSSQINLKNSYEEQKLIMENTNSSLDFSNFDKNTFNKNENNSYQIESIQEIIASSNKIIENFEKICL